MCSPSSRRLFTFFFVALVHDHPVLLFLLSQSLLSHALACVPTVSALLLVSMHPPVLLGVLVLPRPSHLSASAFAIRIRFFLVLWFGLEYPRSSAVVMQCTGWRHHRDAFTDAPSECFSFLSWPFLDPPPSVFFWHCVGSSISCFSSISCTPSHLFCVLLCVRSELITSHLSLSCVVTTFLSGTQFPTCPIYQLRCDGPVVLKCCIPFWHLLLLLQVFVFLDGFCGNDSIQPFSQYSRTRTVAKEFQIGLYDPAEAALEYFWNCCSARFLGERLCTVSFPKTSGLHRLPQVSGTHLYCVPAASH